ncbi:MAG: PQQ-dependent sugar dehydrogenase [Porticoccus sp.]
MTKPASLAKLLTLIMLISILLVIIVTNFIPGLSISSYRVLLNAIFGVGSQIHTSKIVHTLTTPPEFEISIFADHIPNARLLKVTPTGDLLVSSPSKGTVYLLSDSNDDGQADLTTPLVSGLSRPHGIDLYDDGKNTWLYIAETHAVGRININWDTNKTQSNYEHLITDLPKGGNHWTKTIRFGPDGWIYLTAGSSCNVCEETDHRRASMMRFRPDGTNGHIYASGLRNSVGFDWAPWNNNLYATDNGRDLLGDNYPPCELNQIEQHGFYGWPYINGFGDLDPNYGEGNEALLKQSISPSFGFRAHNAPLGIHFLRHPDRPDGYQRTALVALHGSWNRSEPDGYKVIALHWDKQDNITSEDFVSNFLQADGRIIGRPVDIEEGPDGSIYISDDYSGAIYRVLYK